MKTHLWVLCKRNWLNWNLSSLNPMEHSMRFVLFTIMYLQWHTFYFYIQMLVSVLSASSVCLCFSCCSLFFCKHNTYWLANYFHAINNCVMLKLNFHPQKEKFKFLVTRLYDHLCYALVWCKMVANWLVHICLSMGWFLYVTDEICFRVHS